MDSTNYPTVDLDFIVSEIKKAPKVEFAFQVGGTSIYVLKGAKPLFERSWIIKEIGSGIVSYQYATACAYRLKFLPALIDWLVKNRKWKEGAYIV